jgi:hypothetical protein
MAKRDRSKVNANEEDQRRNRNEEHPQRPDPDPLKDPESHEVRREDSRGSTPRRGGS